jgi:hypothetical protein
MRASLTGNRPHPSLSLAAILAACQQVFCILSPPSDVLCRDRAAFCAERPMISAPEIQMCRDCFTDKPIEQFRFVGSSQWRRHQCRKCERAERKRRERMFPHLLESGRKRSRESSQRDITTPSLWCRRITNRLRLKAREFGIPFNITADDVRSVMPADGKCPALGVVLIFGARGPHNPSVDRIIPKLGYVRGNIVVISRRANTLKLDSTPTELLCVATWAAKVTHAALGEIG